MITPNLSGFSTFRPYSLVKIFFFYYYNRNLNKELLATGLAWHYKKYSRDPNLAKLVFEAKAAKRGLWTEPDPVPPWEWRRRMRS